MKLAAYLIVVTLSASWAHAESLAGAATRERERREKSKAAGIDTKVVDDAALAGPATNRDGKSTFNMVTTGEGSGSTSSTSTSTSPLNESPDAINGIGQAVISDTEFPIMPSGASSAERLWRARGQAAQAWVDAAKKRRAGASSTFAANGDASTTSRPGGRARNACGFRRPAYANPDDEVRAAERALSDIEDEARRAGVLPGWLR